MMKLLVVYLFSYPVLHEDPNRDEEYEEKNIQSIELVLRIEPN